MNRQDDLLNRIMDASQPEAPAAEEDVSRETLEAEAGETPAPIRSSDGSRSGGTARAKSEWNGRAALRLGYVIAALLAAIFLALLALCLIQLQASRTAAEGLQSALDSLQAADRLEEEKELLQEEKDELTAALQASADALAQTESKWDALSMDYMVLAYLWTAEDMFEEENYEMCAELLRYLFHPTQGMGATFSDWSRVLKRVTQMAARLEELGYLEAGDTMIPYNAGTGQIDLGTATLESDE